MVDFSEIPCPHSLKNAPAPEEPGPFALDHRRAVPGTVWEVQSPTGEILLFLVVERFDRTGNADELPFDFVRAVPLTDHLPLQDAGDVVVDCRDKHELRVAHVWMEGPVCADKLLRLVDEISAESLREVASHRRKTYATPESAVVRGFRETLHDQFGPTFFEWWNEVHRLSAPASVEGMPSERPLAADGGSTEAPASGEEDSNGGGNGR